MSKTYDKWYASNEPLDGHYAGLSGFEKAIQENEDAALAYESLDIYQQIAIYGFVVDLLEKEAKS
jgi:hypothetical protein